MKLAPDIARALLLSGLILFLLTSRDSFADNPSAAELDWVPAEKLSAAERDALPWFCVGDYRLPPQNEGSVDGPVTATASRSEHVDDVYTLLEGDVVITHAKRLITSPRVRIDAKTNVAVSEGPIVIREAGLVMTGSHATTNLFDGTGVIDSATFLLHQSKLRGSAAHIERLASTDLVLKQTEFTRCEPGSEAWSLRGKELQLEERTGFGTAKHVTVNIKGVPIAYFPWLRFPIDNERHTGFLMPSGGYDSSGGTDLIAPYYINIAPAVDATYQPRSLWKRGLIHDGQVRFLAGASSNEMNFGFLHNDGVYDERALLDETSATTDTSSVPVPPLERQDRWYLNLRHDGTWSDRWTSTINYSAVSDIDYLRDIGGDVGSSSVERFVSSVGTSLKNPRSAVLDRIGTVKYRGEGWKAAMTVQGFQPLDRSGVEQYELLPRLSVDYGTKVGPFDFSTDVEYTRFDKDTTGITGPLAIVGARAVVDSSLSWRQSALWGFVEPKLGFVYRKYELDDVPVGARTSPEVTTPLFSLDAGLYFDRFFDWGESAMQQTLEPRIFYLYVEEDDQSDLPQFDAGPLTPGFAQLFRTNRYTGHDRYGDAQQVSVGLTTRFLDADTGHQFIEASLGQIHYFKDRTVNFSLTPADDPNAKASPLFAQARLSLENGLSIGGTFEWEPDVDRSNRGTLGFKYLSIDRKIINFNYTYTSPQVQPVSTFLSAEETDVNFIWPMTRDWSAIGRWNFSWDRHQTVESFYGFEYNDCCWKARFVLRRFLQEPRDVTVLVDDPGSPTGFSSVTRTTIPADTGIFIEFHLKGLATLGRRLDLLLEESIPGYRTRETNIGK